jgi:hypothetical protein
VKGRGNVPDPAARFDWDSPASAALATEHNMLCQESSAQGLGSHDDRTVFASTPNDFPGFLHDDKVFPSRALHAAAFDAAEAEDDSVKGREIDATNA